MLEGFGIREKTDEDIEFEKYIEDLCERNIWLTATNEEIRITDMTDLHIENSINDIKNGAKIRGMAKKYLPKLEAERCSRKELI
jgi:hypothetical protein